MQQSTYHSRDHSRPLHAGKLYGCFGSIKFHPINAVGLGWLGMDRFQGEHIIQGLRPFVSP